MGKRFWASYEQENKKAEILLRDRAFSSPFEVKKGSFRSPRSGSPRSLQKERNLPAALGLRDSWDWGILSSLFSTGDSSGLANFARPSGLGATRWASQAAGRVAASPRPGPSLPVLCSAKRSSRAAGSAGGASGWGGGDEPNCTTALRDRDRASAEETEPISGGRAGPRWAAKTPGGTHTPCLPKVYSLLAPGHLQPLLRLWLRGWQSLLSAGEKEEAAGRAAYPPQVDWGGPRRCLRLSDDPGWMTTLGGVRVQRLPRDFTGDWRGERRVALKEADFLPLLSVLWSPGAKGLAPSSRSCRHFWAATVPGEDERFSQGRGGAYICFLLFSS